MSLLDFNKWYAVNGARVATWLPGTETWDTSVAIPNLQGIMIKPVYDTDLAKIYGAGEHALAVFVDLDITMNFVGKDDPSVVAMTGRSSTSSGSGDSEQRTTLYTGGEDLSYFGLIAQILGQEGADLHLFAPRVKLQDDFGIEFDADSKFGKSDISAKGLRLRLADNTLYPVLKAIEHATVTTIETDFATAFTALS